MASRDAAPKPRLASALSGAMSGMFVSAIVQPLDVVRTRMQVDVNRGVHLSTWKTLRLIVGEVGCWLAGVSAGALATSSVGCG